MIQGKHVRDVLDHQPGKPRALLRQAKRLEDVCHESGRCAPDAGRATRLRKVSARKPRREDVEARWQVCELLDIGVQLDVRKSCGENVLGGSPRLTEQHRVDAISQGAVEAQLDPADASE